MYDARRVTLSVTFLWTKAAVIVFYRLYFYGRMLFGLLAYRLSVAYSWMYAARFVSLSVTFLW